MAPQSNSDSSKQTQTTKRVVRRVVKATTRNGRQQTQHAESPAWVPLVFLAALFGTLFYSFKRASRVTAYFQRVESSPILVFDNVLSRQTCQALHNASVEFRDVSVGKSFLFHWPLETNHKGSNYIEDVIGSILDELYPQQKLIVEYWVRQEWHHTIAHTDTDEELFESMARLRHPFKGHVLYLQRGSLVNGPTVVFANTTRGGEMYGSPRDTEMLVVPFVDGRLLQFEGDLLHAVPRPADLWFHPTNQELIHTAEYERSVVLFNLWKEPPMGLKLTTEMEARDTKRDTKTLCNPKSNWQQALIVNDWQESLWDVISKRRQRFQLPLMGSPARRGTKDVTLELEATNLVEDALVSSLHDTRPKCVYLETPSYKLQTQGSAEEL